MEPLLTQLLGHGILGLVAAIVLWLYISKDKELTKVRDEKDKELERVRVEKDKDLAQEKAARIADAKAYNDLALGLQKQVIEMVHKLGDIYDETRKPRLGR